MALEITKEGKIVKPSDEGDGDTPELPVISKTAVLVDPAITEQVAGGAVKEAKQILEKKYGKGEVNIKHPSQAEEHASEKVGEHLFASEPANVGLSIAHTKNLGNYESVKVQVSLHIPCTPSVEDINHTFEQIEKWCDEKMASVLSEL